MSGYILCQVKKAEKPFYIENISTNIYSIAVSYTHLDVYKRQRRNRTIYKRMREYLWQLTHSPVLRTSVLPLGDGAAVSVKTGEQVYETTRTIGSGEQP